jgi:hypothetical protein
MSKISLISGVPANEIPQRSAYARVGSPFIPFNNLTKGEMLLALAEERARIYAAYYPDIREYKSLATMYENALYGGVSRGVSFIGSLSPAEQQAAALIVRASKMTQPAVRGTVLTRNLINGVKIGAGPINTNYNCEQIAADEMNTKYRKTGQKLTIKQWKTDPRESIRREMFERSSACDTRKEIEIIVNERLELAAHHVLYSQIDDAFTPMNGSRAGQKQLLQRSGISAIANAAGVDRKLILDWTENGILRINSQSPQIGLIGSQQSGLYVAGQGDDSYWQAYKAFTQGDTELMKAKKRQQGQAEVGAFTIVLAAITALISAIGAAVLNASKMQEQLNNKKNGAFAAAQSYGTPELSAAQNDILNNPNPNLPDSGNNNMLLLGAAGLGLYLLTKD